LVHCTKKNLATLLSTGFYALKRGEICVKLFLPAFISVDKAASGETCRKFFFLSPFFLSFFLCVYAKKLAPSTPTIF
jgi:hypothetical protein